MTRATDAWPAVKPGHFISKMRLRTVLPSRGYVGMKADSERRMLDIQDSLGHIEPGRGVWLNQAGRASGKREQQTQLEAQGQAEGRREGIPSGSLGRAEL